MITEITITIKPDEENTSIIQRKIESELSDKNINAGKDFSYIMLKRSVDARHGQIKLHLRYKVFIGEKQCADEKYEIPKWKQSDSRKKILIIGSGPAGLFGALKLLEYGIKPIIIERGEETFERKRRIAKISTVGILDNDSNYCFGEGGAGTFSDGKLFTRSSKRGNNEKILQIFAFFGADKKILTDSHPHIGTDKLPAIINAIKNKIKELGGEFYFNTRCEDLIVKDGKAVGINVKNVRTQEEDAFYADALILATGHSSIQVYEMISRTAPAALEAKTFAAGVRIEHPRELIDRIQYKNSSSCLGAAEYRLTAQSFGRGVYTFCMCPGGFIVPSATSEDTIVVNGMSAASRNSKWSNSAVVVEIRPEDIPQEFYETAKARSSPALAGLYFRNHIEREAKLHGCNQQAPAQNMIDFINGTEDRELLPTSYTPGVIRSRLDGWLPQHITKRLREGFEIFDKSMHGFISEKALLVAPETRTSTPVRILRDKNTMECTAIKSLYPAGEGSGYSGGIVSSAIDGENAAKNAAEAIINLR